MRVPARWRHGPPSLPVLPSKVALAADSVSAGSPRGDLRLFIAGEIARDSLLADRFAARQFRRVAGEWPSSPFAPKAMLALILLQPDRADSLRAALLAGLSRQSVRRDDRGRRLP